MNRSVYLDTSVISALFDQRSSERQRMTQAFWQHLNPQTTFISALVSDELDAAQEFLRHQFAERTKDFKVLPITSEAMALADRYIEEGIFPSRYQTDALHVAIAVVHHVEYLVSWNFAHLVKVRTRRAVNLVNALTGFPAIEIISPPEF